MTFDPAITASDPCPARSCVPGSRTSKSTRASLPVSTPTRASRDCVISLSFPDAFLTLLMFISIIETSAAARDGGRGDGPWDGGELLGSDAGLGTHILACLIARSAPWVAYIKTGCMRHPAGDVTSWTHPAGFTVTNQINSAQQITQISQSPHDNASYPQYLATSITYTPFGSIGTLVNGCVPSGSCTQRQDSYDYNNRLQPVRIQLGTSSNNPGGAYMAGFPCMRSRHPIHHLRGTVFQVVEPPTRPGPSLPVSPPTRASRDCGAWGRVSLTLSRRFSRSDAGPGTHIL